MGRNKKVSISRKIRYNLTTLPIYIHAHLTVKKSISILGDAQSNLDKRVTIPTCNSTMQIRKAKACIDLASGVKRRAVGVVRGHRRSTHEAPRIHSEAPQRIPNAQTTNSR